MPSKKSRAHPKRREGSSPHIQRSPETNLKASESGGYLLSPDAISAVPSAMLCVGGSAASPRHAPVSAHTAHRARLRSRLGDVKRRLDRPGHKRYGLSQKENIGLSIFRATAKKSLVIEQGQRCHTPAHIIIIRA